MKTEEEFCLSLIGKPWVSGARGPEAFDCWGLLCHIYLELLGLRVSLLGGLDAKNTAAVVRAAEAEAVNWEKVAIPQHLCAVAMSTNKRTHHVGVWLGGLEGGVLHSVDHTGVIFQHRASLGFSGIQSLKFYVPNK